MRDPNRDLLEAAAHVLQPLLNELVFLGGCATGLFLTDPVATGLRPTKDVDTITEIGSYAEYASLSERLRGWVSRKTQPMAHPSAGGGQGR
jgi:hypothetical protein